MKKVINANEHNKTWLNVPAGERQTSWLFTDMAEVLNWCLLRNNSANIKQLILLIAVRARLEPVTSGLLIRTTQSRCLLINFSSFNSFDVKAF